MTGRIKSPDPDRRMGVYKCLSDVPDRYRLRQYSSAYAGEDTWADYIDHVRATRPLADSWYEYSETVSANWKAHMDDRGSHHALATPADVEAWVEQVHADRTWKTTYEHYWARLEAFYSWLLYHAEHPHVYHPFLMAAAKYDNAGRVWARKMESADRKRQRTGAGSDG